MCKIHRQLAHKTATFISASALTLCLALSAPADRLVAARKHLQVKDIQQPPLVVGKTIERDLESGQTHSYNVAMSVGQFLHVVVDQHGIDLVVQVFGPDSNLISEFDSPNGTEGPEDVTIVAEATGLFRLAVRSLDTRASGGHYKITLVELRESTIQDKSRVNAARAYAEATALMAQGTAESLQAALGKFEQALRFYRAAEDRLGEAGILNLIGGVNSAVGQKQKALEYYLQALASFEAIGSARGEAVVLTNIGAIYDDIGEKQRALPALERALLLWRNVGDRSGEATTLNNIGRLHDSVGNKQKALAYYSQALALHNDVSDPSAQATTLNNIAAVYSSMGAKRDALNYYLRALTLYRQVRDRRGEGVTTNNLGNLYNDLGESRMALNYYEQALLLAQSVGDRSNEAMALNNLGKASVADGKMQQGLNYYQRALKLRREVSDRFGEAATLGNLAQVYESLGEMQQTLDLYNQALQIYRDIFDRAGEAGTLNNLGAVYSKMGQKRTALKYYEQVVHLAKVVGDRFLQASVFSNLGALHYSLGDSENALQYYLQCVAIRESLRSDIDHAQSKLLFDDESAGIYARIALIYITTRQPELAFQMSERMRARGLLDQLANPNAFETRATDPQYRRREADLREQLSRLEKAKSTEQAKPAANVDHSLLARLDQQVSDIQREYEQLLIQVKRASPKYASLLVGRTLTLSEVQKLLQPNITLVSYWVTPDKTLIFAISNKSFQAVEVPVAESELANLIREFRTFQTITNSHPENLRRLHDYLITPILGYLKTPVVGLIPDGVLHYLPFSALHDGTRFFDEDFTTFYLPSASAFQYILQNRKNDHSLLTVAYAPEERQKFGNRADTEVRAIANIYGDGARVLTGVAANKNNLRALAGKYGILHLAADYQLNTENPLSSRILLAPSQTDDGALQIHDVYDLDLSRTDLVVLSACQTQMGKQTAGDDLIGVNRGFLYAGAASVIGSLWDVNEEATNLLMRSFYKHLTQGQRKVVALQSAQREVRVKYPNPYYWAAFVLTGDPGP